jgi:hypothetical protein
MASYLCDRCLKRFSSYYNVRRHKANHCAYAKIDDNASMEGEEVATQMNKVWTLFQTKKVLRKLRKR